MDQISLERLMELYVDTISKCGLYLLSMDDRCVEYNIFEEFDIGVISFLHADTLKKLNKAGLISDQMMEKSSTLRNWVQALEGGEYWNVTSVRYSSEWREILELADEIKFLLESNVERD